MRSTRFIFIFVLICAFCGLAIAQSNQGDEWTRVQTDNGEFSVELPGDFFYFFDADGFRVSTGSADFRLRESSIANAYRDGTLVSFEIYRAERGALNALIDTSVRRGTSAKGTKFRDITVKEIILTEDKVLNLGQKFYFASRYFKSNEFIYVLTVLSRDGETPVMKRFLDSLRFTPGSKEALPDVTRLSALKSSPIDMKMADVSAARPSMPTDKPVAAPNEKPLLIVSRPRATYIDAARERRVTGEVRLRIGFGKKGDIPSIEVLKSLPEGLLRQAIFAAMRLKFLPAEKNGEPVTTKKVLEYTFSIY